MTNDFLSIQNELISKLELKEIEIEKNLTTINELLQINKNDDFSKQIIIENGDTSTNSVSMEKYKVLLNLYTNDQELIKQLKSDYLNLIQNLGNYLENGNKINLDFNKINQIYLNNNKRTNENNNNNFEDEMDSIELGRINENDLLTDKNSTLSNKRIDSRDSKNSNSINIFLNNNNNLVSKNKINNNNKQINNLKLDIKKYKNECEKLKKKLNDANDILITVTNALIKLLNEVNLNTKIKDLFTLIFRLLNYTEDKINKLFSEKEKINNNK